mgnify:CR=1 FL=1
MQALGYNFRVQFGKIGYKNNHLAFSALLAKRLIYIR